MRACLDFGLIVIFMCFTCVISQQWHSVNSNWDDGSFSSTGGTWNNGGNTGVGMVNAVPWYGGNVQWTFVPFYQMSGMSQRSTVHRWDDGSTTTHDISKMTDCPIKEQITPGLYYGITRGDRTGSVVVQNQHF